MAKVKKAAKPRPKKYEEKLAINATFAEVFQVIKKNKEETLAKKSQNENEDTGEKHFPTPIRLVPFFNYLGGNN